MMRKPSRSVDQRRMPNVLFTIPARTLRAPHFRRVRVALSLPPLRRWWAALELEVRRVLPAGKRVGSVSGEMVFGANGNPTVRFSGAGRAVRCGGRHLPGARQLRLVQQVRQ